MPSLPASMISLLQPFASLFAAPTWRKIPVLLVGAILAPGQRTVSSALQVLGLHAQRDFACYHHVLSRAVESSLAVSRAWQGLLGPAPAPPCHGRESRAARPGRCVATSAALSPIPQWPPCCRPRRSWPAHTAPAGLAMGVVGRVRSGDTPAVADRKPGGGGDVSHDVKPPWKAR